MNDPKSAAPVLPQIYASHIQITASVSEISMLLAVNGTPQMGGAEIGPAELVGVLRLSPHAAKALQIALTQVMNAYEERFAKVQLGIDTERALELAAPSTGPARSVSTAKPKKLKAKR